MPGHKRVKLLLSDDVTEAILPVYITYGSMGYIPGLIPGMRVAFYGLERRMTTRQKVYAQYSCQSNCRLVAFDADVGQPEM